MTQREIIGKTPKISKLAIALAIAGLMIIGGFVVLASSQPTATSPPATAAATSQSILPNPTLNTNVTWSTFYSEWNPLEYNNGTGNQTLNTQMSAMYTNPISVNPSDIIAPSVLQHDYIPSPQTAGTYWANTSFWNLAQTSNTYANATYSTITQNGHKALKITSSTTNSGSSWTRTQIAIPISDFPSNNPAYDFLTMSWGLSYTTGITGSYAGIAATNNTAGQNLQPILINTENNYFSYSFSQLAKITGQNWNPTNDMTGINIVVEINLPATSTASTYSLTLTGFAIGETPMTLGTTTTNNGAPQELDNFTGTAHLSSFNPSFSYQEVAGSGYTVATSQQMQNPIESQQSINNNGYSEQVMYQGTYNLPNTPDLQYGQTNISMIMTTKGSQFTLANLNGQSFLTQLENRTNGTFSFGIVNPNNQNSIILQLDYTQSQWNSVSGAPPFFSLAGLEYYWWVGLIGFFSLIGLGSAALAHWGGEEENLRTPKGKFGR